MGTPPHSPYLASLVELASNLEKNESEKPLHDYLGGVERALSQPALSGVLLPLDDKALPAVLQEISGGSAPAFSWLEDGPSFLQVAFHPGPARWFDPVAGWKDIAPGFSCDASLRTQTGDVVSLSLSSSAAGHSAWNGFSFLVPRSIALTDSPSVLNRLGAESSILYIAGSAAREISKEEHGVLEYLAEQSRLIFRRVLEGTPAPSPWWQQSYFPKSPSAWSATDSAFPAETVGGSSWKSELKSLVALYQVEQAAGIIQRRLVHDRQTLLPRKEMADQKVQAMRSTSDGARERASWDQSRQQFMAAMSDVEREAAEPARRFINEIGNPAIEKVLSRIGTDIIDEEMRKKTKVLTIEERFLRQVFRDLHKAFLKNARAEIEKINALTNEAADEMKVVAARYGDMSGAIFELRPEALEKDVYAMFEPTVNYRGEIKIRGFYERFQASRQFIYLILGCFSIVGASYLSHQPIVIAGILVIFVYTLFKSARDHREEEEEQKQRELQRISDTLRNTARQILNDAQNLKLRWYEGRLREFSRTFSLQCENAWKVYSLTQAETQQQKSRDTTAKVVQIDRQLRSLQDYEQKLAQIQMSLRQLRTQSEQNWKLFIDKWPPIG